MLAIAAIAAPQPIKTIRTNWRQLMGRAPDQEIQDRIVQLIELVLARVPHSETHLRTTEVGRYLYIHLYVIVPEDIVEPIDVRLHDRIRRELFEQLSSEYSHLALDIGFTMDARWAVSSLPSDDQEIVHTTDSKASG